MSPKSKTGEFEKGTAPTGGIDYEIKLQVLFALSAFRFLDHKWKLSNENLQACKFDDLVLETDSGDILLQAKCKNKPLYDSSLASANPQNDHFSLAKYFLSYMTTFTFNIKYLILCFTSDIADQHSKSKNQPKFILQEKTVEDFTTLKDIFPNSEVYIIKPRNYDDFIDIILSYQSKLSIDSSEGKLWKNLEFTQTDIESFLKVFLCIKIKEGALDNNIRNQIDQLSKLCSFPLSSYEYIIENVKEWYNLKPSKAAYMTRPYVKWILYGEHNRKEAKKNNIDLSFKDQYSFDNNCKIMHIKPGEKYKLNISKIRYVLNNMYVELDKHKELLFKEVIFLEELENLDNLEDLLECFEVNRIKFLVISLINLPEDKNKRICRKIESILDACDNKKVIAVSQQVFFNNCGNIKVIEEKISFDSLDDKSKKHILEKKLSFQDTEVKLKDLEDIDINEHIIMQMYMQESYCVGQKLKKLSNEKLYLPRSIKNFKKQVFSENEFLRNISKKIAVIEGEPGCGKTSVLIQLGLIWKEQNPTSWIIHLDFKLFKEYFKQNVMSSSNAIDFFCFHEDLKFNWGKQFMNLNKIVVIDGIEEITVADRKELLSFIKTFESSVSKILITTRSYRFIMEQLESLLDIEMFSLVPFTSAEQASLLNYYVDRNSSKTIDHNYNNINNITYTEINMYFNNPLLIEILAEIFLDHIREGAYLLKIDWDKVFNTYQLFTLFFEKKRKLLDSSSNQMQSDFFDEAFNNIIEKLKLIAVRNSFSSKICESLKIDEYRNTQKSIWHFGLLSDEKTFIHKSFEEYLATQYLWDILKTKNEQKLYVILKEIFLNPQYFGICTFLNYLLEFKETEESKKVKAISEIYSNLLEKITWDEEINFINLVALKSLHLLKLLLDSYKDCSRILNIRGRNGMVAIHFFAQDFEILKYLFEKGADLNIKDKFGSGICHYTIGCTCAKEGNDDDYYLPWQNTFIKECSLNIKLYTNSDGAEDNVIRIFEKLVEWNVNINEVNYDKISIAHWLAYTNSLKTLKFLSDKFDLKLDTCTESGNPPIHLAAAGNALDVIKYLVNKSVDLKISDNEKNTLLHIAALNNSINVYKYLVEECGMEEDITNGNGLFPQQCAAASDAIDIIKYFKSRNANLIVLGNQKNTLLHIAALNNSINVYKYLVEECGMEEDVINENGLFPQHCAAQRDAIDIIKYFKSRNVDLKVLDNHKNTLLHMAAFRNSINVYRYLVDECGMAESAKNELGHFPQHTAAERDAIDIVKYFKSRNVDLKVLDNHKNTLLHMAALNNSINVYKYLVEECGIEEDITNENGLFPQHCAAQRGAIDIIKYFKSRNVNLKVLSYQKNTLLHIAALNKSINVYKYLVEECGMEEDVTNENGFYLQHCAAESDAIDIMKYFDTRNVDLKVIDNLRNTLLHIAALNNSINVYKYLVKECGMKEDVTNENGLFPQHCAAARDAIDIMKYFKSRNVDLKVLDNQKNTLLHIAALNNSFNVYKYLVKECGMEEDVTNENGLFPQHCAAAKDAIDIMKYFKSMNVDLKVLDNQKNTLLHIAALNNSFNVYKYLVKKCGMEEDVTNENGCYPQHGAAVSGALDIIKYFKSRNVDLKVLDKEKNTLLHIAALNNSINVYKYLVKECGMEEDVTNENGLFPQHCAAAKDAIDIMKYFKSMNVDLKVLDNQKNTLLHIAALNNSFNVYKYLVKKCGMEEDVTNGNGLFSQQCATVSDAIDIIKYFKSRNLDLKVLDNHKNTLLHIAAYKNSINVYKYLVDECGMAEDAKNEFGHFPQHTAAQYDSIDIIKYFLNRKANLKILDNKHKLLDIAEQYNSVNVFKYLIELLYGKRHC